MIECDRCGNGVFSVAEIHLIFPQEHPDQGLIVECQNCFYDRIIEQIAQGKVDHQQVSFHSSPSQHQGEEKNDAPG
jgi:hypothetical protein